MIPAGRWEPQAKPEKFRRSFQINSLYSPVGAYSWLSYYMDYQTAIETPDGMRSFTNLQDGMPYREKGAAPDKQKVIELRGDYREGTVQDYILFLTMAVDVQRGSKKEGKDGARLEIEVLGHSSKYRTASVLYKVFHGSIEDPYSGAWEDLHQWAIGNELTFERKDGKKFQVAIVFVDSGDGEYTDIVYQFTGRWDNTFPIKGTRALTKRKLEKGDEATRDNFLRYRTTDIGDKTLYSISTNYYKRHIYNALYMSIKAVQENDTENKAGFQDFPRDYSDKYFDMLTAEELRRDGSFHCPEGKRNESLDLRVYNQCAGDVYLDSEVLRYKAWAKEKEWTKSEIQTIDTKYVLRDMEKAILKK
jgi:phage terminase large subunit GpA-like protein